MKKTGFYIIKDKFFEDMSDPYLKGNKEMNKQTKKVNIFNQEKRRILCIANEHDYLGDGTIIHEEELQVGKQYIFVKGEARSYGLMVHLDELPCKYGYQSYLFEELQPYDVQILEKEYNNWIEEMLYEGERAMKEGRCYSLEEVREMLEHGRQ